MIEATFPVLGAAFVLLCVLPLCALLGKGLLLGLESEALGGPLRLVNLKYAILTASSVLPLAWFVSAGVHQAESGQSVLACLLAHEDPGLCLEPALFALLLAVGVGVVWWRTQRSFVRLGTPNCAHSQALLSRLDRVFAARKNLDALRGRVHVTDSEGFAIATRGVFERRVVIGLAFARSLTDDMLAGALAHEMQHVVAFDPLRYLFLELALGVNPCGRFLLAEHAARWKVAREVQCDREAVVQGASPLALADAIVRAARPGTCEAVALSANDMVVLKLRVGLLLAFSESAPTVDHAAMRSVFPVPLFLVALALFLPHQTSTEVLDAVHSGTEQTLELLWSR